MVRSSRAPQFLKSFDWLLLSMALVLCSIGLLEIHSATLRAGAENFFLRQLVWLAVAIGCMFIISAIDYHTLSDGIAWLYLGGVLILGWTLLSGHAVAGSRSWIDFGLFRFQPSELMKMIVVVALARNLSELYKRHIGLTEILTAGLICGTPMLLVLLQPDLGTAVTFVPILAFGVFIRGIRPRALVAVVVMAGLLLPAGWLVLKGYQKDRILTFVDPERDPRGSGYQVIQSKIAVGSGGMWGKGVFEGSQNQLGFLPTRHTDFIFSVVGEELGFVGVAIAIGLFGALIFRSIYHAETATDSLGLFIVMGVVSVYVFHVIVNVGMVIGLVPTTGIPLPFMSYGGSSLMMAFAGLGLVISVRRHPS